jgi:phage/plasmid primase-like uncharacterized protein
VNWTAKRDRPLNADEYQLLKQRWHQEGCEREAEENTQHDEAAKASATILKAASGDPASHPYAVSKSVPFGPLVKRGAWAQRNWQDALLIPIYDADGQLWSVQAINSNGDKDFLRGGKKRGGFHPIGNIHGGSAVLIGEGIATVAAAAESTGHPGAAAMDAGNLEHAARAIRNIVPNAEVILLADNDIKADATNIGVEAATAAARAIGGRVAIPELDGRKCDFWDVSHELGAEGVLHAIANAMKPCNAAESHPYGAVISIRINVTDYELPRTTKLAWDALISANDPPQIFRHGGLAARIEKDDCDYPIIREVTLDRMRYTLARVASWYKKGKQPRSTELPANPPIDVVRDVLATPDLPLPVISHIVEAPSFASDGTLETEPGYHSRSQSYYFAPPDFVISPLQEEPSNADVKKGIELITAELLGDFPFTSEAEKAHAVGLLLLPFVRNLIVGQTPLHLIEKPSPGTGASLLTDVLSYVATGHAAPVMTEARDEEEWRKRITAKLRSGPSVILIDNISRRLDSAALSAAIMAVVWTDRILGHSEDVRIPVRCAWIATGNNPTVSSEIARRSIRIRLDAKRDRPWDRDAKKFRHPDLRGWVDEHRGQLVWSALTLVRAWIAAGSPSPKASPVLGGFEDWSRVIGGILEFSGITGFLKNASELYEASDAEAKIWRVFVAAWWERFAGKSIGVSELFGVATGLDEGFDLGDKSERSQKIRLGKLLGKMRDRQFRDLRILFAGEKDNALLWCLKQSDPWDTH